MFIVICYLHFTELTDYFNYGAAVKTDILKYVRSHDETVMVGFEFELGSEFNKQIVYHGGDDDDTIDSITKEIKVHLNPDVDLKVFNTFKDYKNFLIEQGLWDGN